MARGDEGAATTSTRTASQDVPAGARRATGGGRTSGRSREPGREQTDLRIGVALGRPRPTSPQFSVVIPTHDRREVLLQSLHRLEELDDGPSFEVVVVDDGSRDGTAEAVRETSWTLPLLLISQANAGAAAARNTGAEAARGEFLLFLDDDMEADPRLLLAHHEALVEGADAVVGHIPVHPDSPQGVLSRGLQAWAERRLTRLRGTDAPLELADLLSGQLSVRAHTFRALGGFDAELTARGTFGGEDTDFLHRLQRSGTVRFAPEAVSRQRFVVTATQQLRQWRQAGGSDATLTRKHPGLGHRLRATRGAGLLCWWVWRPVGAADLAVLRRLAEKVAGRIDRGATHPLLAKAYFLLRELQYWAGVGKGGGYRRLTPGLRVLCFHAVEDVQDPLIGEYCVSPQQFEQQLRELLAAGFRPGSVDDLLATLDGRPVDEPRLMLTFDDAYASVLDSAAPIMRDLGLVGCVLSVSDAIGGSNHWDVELGAPPLRMLDAAGLAELAAAGWEIGAHSRSHAHLTQLAPRQVYAEAHDCATALVRRGLPRPRLFAYPYGEHDRRVRRQVRLAGYNAGLALDAAAHRLRADGRNARARFAVPRVLVGRGHTPASLVDEVIAARRSLRAVLASEARGLVRPVVAALLPVLRGTAGRGR